MKWKKHLPLILKLYFLLISILVGVFGVHHAIVVYFKLFQIERDIAWIFFLLTLAVYSAIIVNKMEIVDGGIPSIRVKQFIHLSLFLHVITIMAIIFLPLEAKGDSIKYDASIVEILTKSIEISLVPVIGFAIAWLTPSFKK